MARPAQWLWVGVVLGLNNKLIVLYDIKSPADDMNLRQTVPYLVTSLLMLMVTVASGLSYLEGRVRKYTSLKMRKYENDKKIKEIKINDEVVSGTEKIVKAIQKKMSEELTEFSGLKNYEPATTDELFFSGKYTNNYMEG